MAQLYEQKENISSGAQPATRFPAPTPPPPMRVARVGKIFPRWHHPHDPPAVLVCWNSLRRHAIVARKHKRDRGNSPSPGDRLTQGGRLETSAATERAHR